MNSHPAIATHYQKRRLMRSFTHLIVLAILFFLPEVMFSMAAPRHQGETVWAFYLKPLSYCIAFYVNYYFIIDHSLGKRYGVGRLAGYNSILVVAILIAMWTASWLLFPHPRRLEPNTAWQISFILRDCVMLVLTISLAVAVKISEKWLNLDRKQQEMMSSQKEEELKSLKSQLNPHFLFNTLNNIYALIAISPDKAQQAVHDLSSLLRYVLYDDNSVVKLSQELSFIDKYVKLMQLRLGTGTPVNVMLDAGDSADSPIAPLLFISLVENAFKHGNTGEKDSPIDISITCKDHTIHCHVSNHYKPDNRSTDSSGIGIANLRRRLDLIYGKNATMNTLITTDTYTVDLSITLTDDRQ